MHLVVVTYFSKVENILVAGQKNPIQCDVNFAKMLKNFPKKIIKEF